MRIKCHLIIESIHVPLNEGWQAFLWDMGTIGSYSKLLHQHVYHSIRRLSWHCSLAPNHRYHFVPTVCRECLALLVYRAYKQSIEATLPNSLHITGGTSANTAEDGGQDKYSEQLVQLKANCNIQAHTL